jgi:hypothetical protein
MKTSHILIGLAVVGAAYWYFTRSSSTAKAADAPTPAGTTATGPTVSGVTAGVQSLVGGVGNFIGSITGKSGTTTTTTARTSSSSVLASTRPPSMESANQVQLT